MNPRLSILTGTLAGQARVLDSARVTLGRDPRCEVRFDAIADPDVSARHAEIRLDAGTAIIRDTASTNGVYVNDTRVRGEQPLFAGDVIRLGAAGPKLRFESDGPAGPGGTTERIAVAVRKQTHGLRLALIACALVALTGAAAALWLSHRADAARADELALLQRRNDSLSTAVDRDLHAMRGRLAGLDSALVAARIESDGLREQLAAARTRDRVMLLSERVAQADTRTGALAAAARMDYESIARAVGRAVVMIAVEMPDGSLYSGSGVGVSARGDIVTNRHLVRGSDGSLPRRIAIAYSDTRDWLPAHVQRVAADGDLALLRTERAGAYPFIARIIDRAPAVGAPVAIFGYPLGTATPMDGSTDGVIVRSTLGVGTVSKSLPGVLQIDAFATEGSSGSPVFAEDGSIAGIVYGGAREAAGRIVYAVPGAALKALLR